MDKKQMDELRAMLEAESDSLKEELGARGRPISEGGGVNWQGTKGGMEGEEPDVTDAADQIEELITNVPLVEELEKRYKEVTAALERMEKGAYGLCGVCGNTIEAARLEANPAATTCIQHNR